VNFDDLSSPESEVFEMCDAGLISTEYGALILASHYEDDLGDGGGEE